MGKPERRKRPRHNLHLEATLVLEEGLVRVPAQLRNASPFGAKIELEAMQDLPERFYVLFGHRLEMCRLIWQEEAVLGLAYED